MTELKKYGFREDFDWETRFVLKTQVGNYEISTVDLGIDHSFGFGKPLYYETMIFSDSGENRFEYYQDRYTTQEEAVKGHEEAVKFVKKTLIKNKKFRVKRNVGKGGLGQKLSGKIFIAEDYWVNITGKLIGDSGLGNLAVNEFFVRTLDKYIDIPDEDKVIYGHIKEGDSWIGHLFHETELKEVKKWKII